MDDKMIRVESSKFHGAIMNNRCIWFLVPPCTSLLEEQSKPSDLQPCGQGSMINRQTIFPLSFESPGLASLAFPLGNDKVPPTARQQDFFQSASCLQFWFQLIGDINSRQLLQIQHPWWCPASITTTAPWIQTLRAANSPTSSVGSCNEGCWIASVCPGVERKQSLPPVIAHRTCYRTNSAWFLNYSIVCLVPVTGQLLLIIHFRGWEPMPEHTWNSCLVAFWAYSITG